MKKFLCICLILALCLCLCSCKSSDYKNAMSLYEAGDYAQAIAAFEALGDYKDSIQMVRKCNYKIAISLMDSGRYEDAIKAFEAISDYEDSIQKITDCELAIQYRDAIALMDAGSYEEAIAVFETLDGYQDSVNLIEACKTIIMDGKYNDAVALMDSDLVQAFEALTALDGYKDSAQKANSIYEDYAAEKIKAANVGDYIPFGTYEQDNNHANGKEYVEWLVLDKKDNKMLVISKYALDCQPYKDSEQLFNKDISWKKSSLREWMNSTFINTAFSSSEQSRIITKAQDKVFLLSLSEVGKYFDDGNTRECQPTDFAIAKGVEIIESDSGICPWWLTGDLDWKELVAVRTDTSIYTWEWPVVVNSIVIFPTSGVRPAMWISTKP